MANVTLRKGKSSEYYNAKRLEKLAVIADLTDSKYNFEIFID